MTDSERGSPPAIIHATVKHRPAVLRRAGSVGNPIAQLAAQGLSNKNIGQQLFLSHRTVGSHLYRIFPKLGITARSHLRDAAGELGGHR